MAGKIVVSEILSDATSSNTIKIGTGMTLDLNAQGTTVLPAGSLVGALPAISGASLTSLTSGNLSGALPAISGASLTNLPAGGVAGITTASSSGTAIKITSGNNVGLGVSTPEGVLEIERGTYGSPFGTNVGLFEDSLVVLGNSTASNDLSQITFGYNDPTNSGRYGSAYMGFKNTSASAQGAGDLVFGTRSSSVSTTQPTERLKITSDGRGLSQFTAKAWCTLNGTGTISIRDSHNISSVNDIGTGAYTHYFANNLGNGVYSCFGAGVKGSGGASNSNSTVITFGEGPGTTNQTINCLSISGTLKDPNYCYFMVFGD